MVYARSTHPLTPNIACSVQTVSGFSVVPRSFDVVNQLFQLRKKFRMTVRDVRGGRREYIEKHSAAHIPPAASSRHPAAESMLPAAADIGSFRQLSAASGSFRQPPVTSGFRIWTKEDGEVEVEVPAPASHCQTWSGSSVRWSRAVPLRCLAVLWARRRV